MAQQQTSTAPRCGGWDVPAGGVPACQLCPKSPTYWRNKLTPDQRRQVEAADAGRWLRTE